MQVKSDCNGNAKCRTLTLETVVHILSPMFPTFLKVGERSVFSWKSTHPISFSKSLNQDDSLYLTEVLSVPQHDHKRRLTII